MRYTAYSATLFLGGLLVAAATAFAAAESPCPYTWNATLTPGSSGADVLSLQRFLNGAPDTRIASTGPGSPGNESTYFGEKTKAAVVLFQEKYSGEILTPNGLTKGTGIVGASTRALLNTLCAAAPQDKGISTRTQVAAAAALDLLTVTDPGQEGSPIVPQGSGALFLTFELTAGSRDVTVRSVTVQRTGLGADTAFSSIALWGTEDGGLQIGNIQTLNSQHRVVFRTPFVVPAGETMILEVYGNMAEDLTDYVGQQPVLTLESIDASSPVSGEIPLAGPAQKLDNTLTVGSATMMLSAFDPGADQTKFIADTNVRFAGVRLTANSQEDLTFYNLIWEQAGTAGSNDLANVTVYVDGKPYKTVFRGPRQYIGVFEPEITIKKGNSVDVYIQGDLLASAAGRTVKFDIHDNTDDINLSGNLYGFGVGAVPGGNTASSGNSVFLTDDGTTGGSSLTPFYSGPQITVSSGAATSITR